MTPRPSPLEEALADLADNPAWRGPVAKLLTDRRAMDTYARALGHLHRDRLLAAARYVGATTRAITPATNLLALLVEGAAKALEQGVGTGAPEGEAWAIGERDKVIRITVRDLPRLRAEAEAGRLSTAAASILYDSVRRWRDSQDPAEATAAEAAYPWVRSLFVAVRDAQEAELAAARRPRPPRPAPPTAPAALVSWVASALDGTPPPDRTTTQEGAAA
jgi:hypothetical protein